MSWLPCSAASTCPANLLKAGLSRLPYRFEFDSMPLMPLVGPTWPMCADLHRGQTLAQRAVFSAMQMGLGAYGPCRIGTSLSGLENVLDGGLGHLDLQHPKSLAISLHPPPLKGEHCRQTLVAEWPTRTWHCPSSQPPPLWTTPAETPSSPTRRSFPPIHLPLQTISAAQTSVIHFQTRIPEGRRSSANASSSQHVCRARSTSSGACRTTDVS
jgi:hypothetical protein